MTIIDNRAGAGFIRSYVLAENTFIDPKYEFYAEGWIDQYAVIIHSGKQEIEPLHVHITDDFDHLSSLWKIIFTSKNLLGFEVVDEKTGIRIKHWPLAKKLRKWLKRKNEFNKHTSNARVLVKEYRTLGDLPEDHVFIRKDK